MLPLHPDADCTDCVPSGLETSAFGPRAAFSTIPFGTTFILITLIAYRKVYPLLSSPGGYQNKSYGNKSQSPTAAFAEPSTQILVRRIAAATFSSTIALSAVLTELLLCEISNSFNPTARSIALQITVASLLGLLVVAIPLLGISSVVSKSGYRFGSDQQGKRRLAWMLELVGYAVFLVAFWFIGALLPAQKSITDTLNGQSSIFQACLDRLGITGVTFMALLSGFASVSAVWQNFGPRPPIIAEPDITRKQTGLDATNEMVMEKKNRLRRLEEKMVEPSTQSFWSRTVGSFRGNADTQEKQTLEMEISGLETMASSLETSLSLMRARRLDQQRKTTRIGRLSLAFGYVFSCYCIYRIITTAIAISRRMFFPSALANSSDSDPITSALALVARYIYPSLDRASWTQQISFLLSGAMLFLSFSAVTQTFHLFSRFLPSLLQATKTNFALFISQISGMYVISSALMLRGMMPKEVGGVINSALGAGLLEPKWVQKWFDGFFMFAVLATSIGIWAGRQISGLSAIDDDVRWDADIELGKRS